ncbi:MAG: transcription antitermination factor NusB [Pseudomonadales bacterium]|jgi:N utilization substance protein B|nr:transcription antitermination factor NusB [Pseudomonadales bacterium]
MSTGNIPISYRKRARDLLVQALYQWQLSGTDAAQVEAEFRADNGRKTDWEFFHAALSAIASDSQAIDALYHPYLDRNAGQLDPIELGILRLGLYELSQRIEVPYRVVINEYVELAKKYGATDSHKYINGILDKAARELRKVEWGR